MKGRTLVAICACAVISGLLYLLLAGVVDSQRFGIAGLGVMTVAAFALYFVSRRENACTDQAKNLKGQSNKSQYVWAALLLLWLLVALWATRGGPWLPRLVGALFLVLYFVVRMRRKSTKT
jgi:hypothetical protein